MKFHIQETRGCGRKLPGQLIRHWALTTRINNYLVYFETWLLLGLLKPSAAVKNEMRETAPVVGDVPRRETQGDLLKGRSMKAQT